MVRRSEDRTHLAFGDWFRPSVCGALLFLGVVSVFFRMGWHIPDDLQLTFGIMIFVPCMWLFMWFFLSFRGVKKRN